MRLIDDDLVKERGIVGGGIGLEQPRQPHACGFVGFVLIAAGRPDGLKIDDINERLLSPVAGNLSGDQAAARTQAKLGRLMTGKRFQHPEEKRVLFKNDILEVKRSLTKADILHVFPSDREPRRPEVWFYEFKLFRRAERDVHAIGKLAQTSIWVRISDAVQLVGDSLVNGFEEIYSRRSRLDTPPGYRLNAWAEFVYSICKPNTMKR